MLYIDKKSYSLLLIPATSIQKIIFYIPSAQYIACLCVLIAVYID